MKPTVSGLDGGAPDSEIGLPGPGVLRGSLDKEDIRKEVRRHNAQLRGCYERALNHRPDLTGRITIRFAISPTGQVLSSGIQSSTINSAEVDDCTGRAVCDWRFPPPNGGGIVIVSYPFNFTSGH
jgi:TonB family protein